MLSASLRRRLAATAVAVAVPAAALAVPAPVAAAGGEPAVIAVDAAASGAKAKSSSRRGAVVTYKVRGLKATKVRRASLRSGKRRSKPLSIAKVRKGVKKGIIRVTVPPMLLTPGAAGTADAFTTPQITQPKNAPTLVIQTPEKTVHVAPVAAQPAAPAAQPAPSAPRATGSCSFGTFAEGNWPGACWRPYGDDSPFNRRLPANPKVAANSSTVVGRALGFGPITHLRAGTAGTEEDYGDVTYWSRPSDPEYTIHCVEDWGRCAIEGHVVRIPAAAQAAKGSDGHMTVIDQQSGWEYDFWTVRSKGPNGGRIDIGWGGRTRIDGDGLGSDGTAAQFGNLAGKLRVEELEAGRIDHALFIAMGCDNGTYVYPASKTGQSCSDIGQSNAGAPAMGSHFMLDMTAAEIEALPVPAWKKTILHALAEYGAFMGDTGGAFTIAEESGATYTSFGKEDKWVRFAKENDVPYYAPDDVYVFNIRDGVDWKSRLKVVDPCVAQGTC